MGEPFADHRVYDILGYIKPNRNLAMDFGMFTEFYTRDHITEATSFEESFAQVLAAEQVGMDHVWLAEHHFSPDRSVLSSPLIVAGALAAQTKRIRIGVAVQILPLANPIRVAEEAATVDHICKGRFDFGIGRSGLTKYYKGYDIDYAESRDRFFESLDIIMKAWHNDEVSHNGEYYTCNSIAVVPKPYQKPHPPTRIAVTSADTFELVGTMGYPIFIQIETGIPQLEERLKIYREARIAAGHTSPPDILFQLPAYIAETDAKAHADAKASIMHAIQYPAKELDKYVANPESREMIRRSASIPYEEILQKRVVCGTAESVLDRLQEYKEKLGFSGLVLQINYGGLIAVDRVVNATRLLMEKVAPRLS